MKKDYKYIINGNTYEVAIGDIVENTATVIVNGEKYQVEMESEPIEEKKVAVHKPVAIERPANVGNTNNAVKAPLPGLITDVCVKVGDEVNEGDPVVVLEAMKMANNIEAEKGGKVTAVCVQPGQTIMEGDVLVVIE